MQVYSLLQMVHETSPSDTLPISPALPSTPGLTSKRPMARVVGKLQKGMSIIDHDLDLEDDNGGLKKRGTQVEVP